MFVCRKEEKLEKSEKNFTSKGKKYSHAHKRTYTKLIFENLVLMATLHKRR